MVRYFAEYPSTRICLIFPSLIIRAVIWSKISEIERALLIISHQGYILPA